MPQMSGHVDNADAILPNISHLLQHDHYGDIIGHVYEALESFRSIQTSLKEEADQSLQLLTSLFPVLISISFVPSCISTLSYLMDQTVAFWAITSLLLFGTLYIVLCVCAFSALPSLSVKLEEKISSVYQDIESYYNSAAVLEGRDPVETKEYLDAALTELRRVTTSWIWLLHIQKYSQTIINDRWLLNAVTLAFSVAIALILLISKKTASFNLAALAQLYFTVWILVVNVLIAYLAHMAIDTPGSSSASNVSVQWETSLRNIHAAMRAHRMRQSSGVDIGPNNPPHNANEMVETYQPTATETDRETARATAVHMLYK